MVMAALSRLDAHQKPPDELRAVFKKYQKVTADGLEGDQAIIDPATFRDGSSTRVQRIDTIQSEARLRAFRFLSDEADAIDLVSKVDVPVYEVTVLPGLFIIPSLLSPALQTEMLNRLLHRDLANPDHKTNLHLHYNIAPEQPSIRSNGTPPADIRISNTSYFSENPSMTFQPKDEKAHKELSLGRMLERKLRWITLGGQYDWTAKVYPQGPPPPFPSDIAGVLKSLFPSVDPQAAILNFYSPGDTLSVHRDVSEECDRGLISLSFGCEAVFVVGNEDGSSIATIRLRSGDALLMSNNSRFAWHGVPKVFPGTCPDWLKDWPMVGDDGIMYQQWKGWMAGKRLNLNVRQMSEDSSSSSINEPPRPPN